MSGCQVDYECDGCMCPSGNPPCSHCVHHWTDDEPDADQCDDNDLCPHDSLSGDEGPVLTLGRMPHWWRCDECGAVVYDRDFGRSVSRAECDCPMDPHHRWNCALTPIWAQTIRDLDCNPWSVTRGFVWECRT